MTELRIEWVGKDWGEPGSLRIGWSGGGIVLRPDDVERLRDFLKEN